MLLAIDIGNSNIVFGFWDKTKWLFIERFETHPAMTAAYVKKISASLKSNFVEPSKITHIVVSSVVPQATQPFFGALNSLFAGEPLLVDSTIDTGIKIDTARPEKVGTDILANATATYNLIQNNCIVVDFGTATTVMAIQKPGVLLGGAICAGLKTSKDALTGKAAQLFDFELKPPPSVLGKNTIETMQSGLVIGHVAMVEGLIARLKNEVGPCRVVATGGMVNVLAPLTDIFDFVEPNLTLDGLLLIALKNSHPKP